MQGLKNLGSTCAINSLIQIICRNKFLRESILNEDIPENTLSIELKEILKILYIDKNSVSPNKFINALYNFLNNFKYGEQIDITELWFILYDKIASEIFKSVSKIPYLKEYDDMTLNNPRINNKADYIISTLNDNKTSNWLKKQHGNFKLNCDAKKVKLKGQWNEIAKDIPIVRKMVWGGGKTRRKPRKNKNTRSRKHNKNC